MPRVALAESEWELSPRARARAPREFLGRRGNRERAAARNATPIAGPIPALFAGDRFRCLVLVSTVENATAIRRTRLRMGRSAGGIRGR